MMMKLEDEVQVIANWDLESVFITTFKNKDLSDSNLYFKCDETKFESPIASMQAPSPPIIFQIQNEIN